jgi:hypothetical protein
VLAEDPGLGGDQPCRLCDLVRATCEDQTISLYLH